MTSRALLSLILVLVLAPAAAAAPAPPTYATPATSIVAGGGLTNDATPALQFGSSLAGSTFTCRWAASPGEVWSFTDTFDCGTGTWTAPHRPEGEHHLQVRACKTYEDPEEGDVTRCDQTPAEVAITVDTAAPAVTFTDGPAPGAHLNEQATWRWDVEPGVAYSCEFDQPAAADLSGCGEGRFALAWGLREGWRSFTVRARDAAGNETAVVRKFAWDVPAPVTYGRWEEATRGERPTIDYWPSTPSALRPWSSAG